MSLEVPFVALDEEDTEPRGRRANRFGFLSKAIQISPVAIVGIAILAVMIGFIVRDVSTRSRTYRIAGKKSFS
jgi:hypothetical protein